MANMKTADKLVEHFGGAKETIEALDINRETLRLWLRDGIPLTRALHIEEVTRNAITADEILKEAREAA